MLNIKYSIANKDKTVVNTLASYSGLNLGPDTDLLVTVAGWYHTERPAHCGHFLIYCGYQQADCSSLDDT